MILKSLFTFGSYEKSLRRRLALALLCVGLVGFVCYFLLVPGSSLSDFAQGFYLGASSGISAGALILLLRVQYLLTHPEQQKKAQIKENDERERKILHSALLAAGVVTFFAVAASLFVVLPLNPQIFQALLAVMTVYCLVFLVSVQIIGKRL